MRKRVLFVHGGGEGAYEADEKLAASLRDALGNEYDVRHPKMPDAERSELYAAWQKAVQRSFDWVDKPV